MYNQDERLNLQLHIEEAYLVPPKFHRPHKIHHVDIGLISADRALLELDIPIYLEPFKAEDRIDMHLIDKPQYIYSYSILVIASYIDIYIHLSNQGRYKYINRYPRYIESK